ncbi:hypothetical protein H0A71_06110 [Alcaligenaceae bacterium]|nr:hypothetical protein [Alcaligenaceae bacterium]
MQRMPFCPRRAGYSASFNDGVRRIELDGGPGRYSQMYVGGSDLVDASWKLKEDDYSLFMALVRNWSRSGGMPFEIGLKLDSHALDWYRAQFIPKSVRLTGMVGPWFYVSAQLEVTPLQKYLDPEQDVWAIIAELMPYYGSVAAVREMFNLLEQLVNYDWPS